MNNLEKNALRIAELMGLETHISIIGAFGTVINKIPNTCVINKFMEYSGLMPLVFECKKSKTYTINILTVSVVFGCYDFMNEFEVIHGKSFNNESEESPIEAIQECVIKYLELKNEIH